nr:MAG TPA: hypothetical protein [Caudoviricetes sp.]
MFKINIHNYHFLCKTEYTFKKMYNYNFFIKEN